MSERVTRPSIKMDCPVAGCGRQTDAYNGPSNGVEDAEEWLRSSATASVDALVVHIREDHIGHPESCPRSKDRNDYCDCHVHEPHNPLGLWREWQIRTDGADFGRHRDYWAADRELQERRAIEAVVPCPTAWDMNPRIVTRWVTAWKEQS